MTPIAQALCSFDLLAEQQEGVENVKIACPFRGERTPSLSINLNTGQFLCFGCGARGTLLTLIAAIEQCNTLQAGLLLAELELGELAFPERGSGEGKKDEGESIADAHLRFLRYAHVDWHAIPHHYLLDERHFERKTLEHFQVRLNMRSTHSIVFPLFSQKRFGGYVCRRIDGEKPKYINNRGLHKDDHLYGDLTPGLVMVVEGKTCEMRAWEYGMENVAPLLGSHISDKQYAELLRYGQVVLIALDNDEAGQAGTQELVVRLKEDGRSYRLFPWKENDHDICALSRKQFQARLANVRKS